MTEALYGEQGFYAVSRRGPGLDYRTSSTASEHFARAIVELLCRVDAALGHPDALDFVEVAAAEGALLKQVRTFAPQSLLSRLRLHGVELRPRPEDLHPSIGWSTQFPQISGVLFANEWLDNVPVDVVEQTENGAVQVLVAADGQEALGPAADRATKAWLEWWPLTEEGDRAEVGLTRDRAWANALEYLVRGIAVSIDYCTFRQDREDGAFPAGTLTAYRNGRQCLPVPDGSCDITAHVAIDAVMHATVDLVDDTTWMFQSRALENLGIHGKRPQREEYTAAPGVYLSKLMIAGEHAELVTPPLGTMVWLLQTKGIAAENVLRPS